MRIDADHAQAWLGDAPLLQGLARGLRGGLHIVSREACNRSAHALVQRGMDNAQPLCLKEQMGLRARHAQQVGHQAAVAGKWCA